jgi:arylsulfatase A-like enzyme
MVSEQVMITMDWLPTLLAAAGTSPDAAYPADGEDIGPVMTGRVGPHPRKLYWRYKAGAQRANRDGDWKYLRIAGNEFIFNAPALVSAKEIQACYSRSSLTDVRG